MHVKQNKLFIDTIFNSNRTIRAAGAHELWECGLNSTRNFPYMESPLLQYYYKRPSLIQVNWRVLILTLLLLWTESDCSLFMFVPIRVLAIINLLSQNTRAFIQAIIAIHSILSTVNQLMLLIMIFYYLTDFGYKNRNQKITSKNI